ncbi:MAG: helix-turn-helix domain-containing protein [Ewingella americana]|jgi:HTH-type transcriptional regulator/antitoxin HigA|uniref:helix-turn-helix domain-containing protein n=1 Tax=Ewingella americana TaxID=41202 RepID=UPI00242AFF5F|nr:helix-turn-helix domain-containing protein [Ewingella americana]MCI1679843.1 helix-turn-helix domain-containing protein [Ewingella americana]MCI1855527.1 helix-turn-helix domain-containing protein [Ewingella americana]MCI1862979.1 helix-turn-helix domain-containing protein [Ewingella americana]MCI2140653.1 helix-turn-helix domain-containing protein [Ewingella americana]MCI2165803.1 helix-turn-helix domain-containing protein [Ewingella americana]
MISDAIKATEELVNAVPLLGQHASEKDYREALELVEYLLMNHPHSPLLDIVSNKIREYENSLPEVVAFRAEMEALPSGVAVLATLMEQYGLKQTDFQDEIGGKSLVSRILSGQRQLTVDHIDKLAKRFEISPALFI